MRINHIEDLPWIEDRAVIINCGTKEVSTLALLSTLRYAGVPILLIDCESRDGSLEHFLNLMTRLDFDVLSAPLRGHGITLDWLFGAIKAEKILLVDSDVEILDATIFRFMREFIDEPSAFGAGFVNGPTWIDDLPGDPLDGAYLQERPWMPLTLLKVKFIREALAAGISFSARTIYNDFFFSETLSRRLVRLRSIFPWFRRFQSPKMLRQTYYGHRPSLIYCDTGALMLQHLKYQRELSFVGLPDRYHRRYVTHFGGITRIALEQFSIDEPRKTTLNDQVSRRLKDGYGMVISE